MDYFSYGNFDPNNADIAFSATNQYSSPASELETRKQLSYPLKELKDYINDLKDYIDSRTGDVYPVGSIYMSVNNTNPSTLFPNTTWEQLKDRFLLGAGTTYAGGTTGGSATTTTAGTVGSHTLTLNEIPSHRHTVAHKNQAYSEGAYIPGCMNYGGDETSYTGYAGGGQGHTHGFTGSAINNMPPYLTVWIWKRIA